MPRQCSICSSAASREVDRRLKVGSTHADIVLYLASQGLQVHRTTVARHARHVAGAGPRRRGPREASGDFLTNVVSFTNDDLVAGELRPTVRDGIAAQQAIDNRLARNADRDLMSRIALVMTGGVKILSPESAALEAEYRLLLEPGDTLPMDEGAELRRMDDARREREGRN